jgi:pSer/pThr/pTyr-binding forkhead associated (FHA) protein
VTLFSTAPNYSAIVRPLQWLVIALIFLFFLRVMRAVWVEMRPAGLRNSRFARRQERREAAGAKTGRRQLHLEVLEPEEAKGRSYGLDKGEVTIGRDASCVLSTANDIYSSSLHARVFLSNDQIWVEDLGSTNGTFVNAERITKETRLSRGDMLQVGGTVLEVVR